MTILRRGQEIINLGFSKQHRILWGQNEKFFEGWTVDPSLTNFVGPYQISVRTFKRIELRNITYCEHTITIDRYSK